MFSVVLVLLSLVPFILFGGLLDIYLVQWYVRIGDSGELLTGIPSWIFNSLAGNRGLPIEIMLSFWGLTAIGFVLNATSVAPRETFRMRFLYIFVVVWVLALSFGLGILLSCSLPFDLMLARVDQGDTYFDLIVRAILVVELIILIAAPFLILFLRRKNNGVTS